ncbi:MAG: hypothetical protein ACLP1X_26425 [Polyangiaceae bacterium]|jgi:hypothetical protein
MSIRLASFVLIPVVLLAGVLALQGTDHVADATAATPRGISASPTTANEVVPLERSTALPPDHPPVGAAISPHGSMPPPTSEAPAIAWKMPPAWQEVPSPNAMRLATYRAPGGVEVSVSRAGGVTEANVQRWISQFDDVGREGRVEKTLHGLHVVTVDVAGTYVGGGAMTGGPAEPKHDWAMVGAVVEGPSPSYFFKMTGPAAAVRAARSAFDRLVDGITPL